MTLQRWVSLGIVVAGLSVWAYLLLKSDNDPVALQRLVGCYETRASVKPNRLVVLASGKLVFGDRSVDVTGYSDKAGDSLLPRRKLVIAPGTIPTVQLDRGYPLLIRALAPGQSLLIPSESGDGIAFQPRDC